MAFILTSYLDLYDKDEYGNRIPKNFGNENSILDNIKRNVKKYDKFLFVASNEFNHEATDKYAQATFDSFELTLPFRVYNILDSRTEEKASELLNEADLIFLCGGHLPTQNNFFNKIDLRNKIKDVNGFIIGGSAGAMNMADKVLSFPELEGESLDPNFKKILNGLGLTNISILPHYDVFKDYILDEKRYIEDIIFPYSFDNTIYALNNGSYILVDDKNYLYGEAYKINDGNLEKINSNGSIKIIN